MQATEQGFDAVQSPAERLLCLALVLASCSRCASSIPGGLAMLTRVLATWILFLVAFDGVACGERWCGYVLYFGFFSLTQGGRGRATFHVKVENMNSARRGIGILRSYPGTAFMELHCFRPIRHRVSGLGLFWHRRPAFWALLGIKRAGP